MSSAVGSERDGGRQKFRGSAMAVEAVLKTPGVGSESRDYFEGSDERQSSKDEESQKEGENVERYSFNYEQERSQALPRLVSLTPKLVKSLTDVQPVKNFIEEAELRKRCSNGG